MSWYQRRLLRNFEQLERFKSRVRHRVTFTGYAVLVAAAASAPFSLNTTRTQSYQILILLLALLFFALIFRFRKRPRIEIHRQLPPYATAGQTFDYRIQITNSGEKVQSSLSLCENPTHQYPDLEAFTSRKEPGEEKRNIVDRHIGYYRWMWLFRERNVIESHLTPLPDLYPRRPAQIKATLTPMKRGHVELERLTLLQPDPFGLFRFGKVLHIKQSLIVMPKTYRVPELFFKGDKLLSLHAESTAHQIGESEDFTALRDYRPGDPLKHIHWKSSARTGQLNVKQYHEKSQLRYGLILDTDLAPGGETAFEAAISIAASFVTSLPDEDTVLELLMYANQMVSLSTGRGNNDARRAMEALAGLQATGAAQISHLQEQVQTHLPRLNGAVAIFLGHSEEHAQLVDDMMRQGIPLQLFIIHPDPEVSSKFSGNHGRLQITHLDPDKIEEGLAQA